MTNEEQTNDEKQARSRKQQVAHRAARSAHESDDPGREYQEPSSEDRVRSSGASSPSEPRRSGTGERQAPRRQTDQPLQATDRIVPGEILLAQGDIEINVGMPITRLRVLNTADRPVQVGSHFHFAEVNAGLEFDREQAWGKRLNVLSGGAMRFEPGAAEEVELVPIQGQRIVWGLRGLCGGQLDG